MHSLSIVCAIAIHRILLREHLVDSIRHVVVVPSQQLRSITSIQVGKHTHQLSYRHILHVDTDTDTDIDTDTDTCLIICLHV